MSDTDDVTTESQPDQISIDVDVVDAEIVDDTAAQASVDHTNDVAARAAEAARVAKAYDAAAATVAAARPAVDVDDAPVGATQDELIVEDELAQAIAQRDEYLAALQQLKADFDNYRKRVIKQTAEAATLGQEKLIDKLLPTLDTLELAVAHGETGVVESVAVQILDVLTKEGLERIHPAAQPFDPELHEAVAHEEAEPGQDGAIVSEVFRTGYRYNNRVLRPAMVKVRG
jgi:molecular chaperone GrpE